MKIVVDTNVVASAIFFGGKPKELIELIVSRKLEAFASMEIITEYHETIEELCNRYPDKPKKLPLSNIIETMKLIEPSSTFRICRDPDDDKFIQCAADARCLYIVSGDKDLLSVGSYGSVQIVTVTEFFKQYRPQNEE
jgi:putative PIN family toxin of toxin-antitoxin system